MFYYKDEKGTKYAFKEEHSDLIPITKQEFEGTRRNNKNEKLKRINELKKLLALSDYKAIKYAEGIISEEEYAETKSQRQAWRDEINELQNN